MLANRYKTHRAGRTLTITAFITILLCIFVFTIRLCMSKAKEIRNFFYSQYFSDGLRITFGTIIPALVFSAFGSLQTGIIVSLGAMAVGLSDTPGPLHHRRNGMFFSTLLPTWLAIFPSCLPLPLWCCLLCFPCLRYMVPVHPRLAPWEFW